MKLFFDWFVDLLIKDAMNGYDVLWRNRVIAVAFVVTGTLVLTAAFYLARELARLAVSRLRRTKLLVATARLGIVLAVSSTLSVTALSWVCREVPPTYVVRLTGGDDPLTLKFKRIEVRKQPSWVLEAELPDDVVKFLNGSFDPNNRSTKPASNLTLADWKRHINALALKTGRARASYDKDGKLTHPAALRLLTSVEYEALDRTRPQGLEQYAWVASNSGGSAHPSGELRRTHGRKGLADLYGNLVELSENQADGDTPAVYLANGFWFGSVPAMANYSAPIGLNEIEDKFVGVRLVIVDDTIEPDVLDIWAVFRP